MEELLLQLPAGLRRSNLNQVQEVVALLLLSRLQEMAVEHNQGQRPRQVTVELLFP